MIVEIATPFWLTPISVDTSAKGSGGLALPKLVTGVSVRTSPGDPPLAEFGDMNPSALPGFLVAAGLAFVITLAVIGAARTFK